MNERNLYLFGSIDSNLSSEIIKQLILLDHQNNNDITIYINSIGGNVSDGLAIYDVMKMINSNIKTVCIGNASSIAAVILMAGSKGNRYITKNSFVMLHEISIDGVGKISDITLEIRYIQEINELIKKIILECSKITKDNLNSILLNNTWYNAQESKNIGIVDTIL